MENFLNSFKDNTPDITDEQAERLIQRTRENLKCYNSDAQKIEYLKKFSSHESDDHLLSRWLTYYIKREMAIYYKDRTEPLGSLPNLTVSQIQIEIIQNGTLDTFLKYRGFLPFNPNLLTGNMLLLFRLAEIYEPLTKTATDKESSSDPLDKERKRLILELDGKMTDDIKDLIRSGDITNKKVPIFSKGERIDFKDSKLAVAVFDRWRENHYVSDISQKNQIIEDNITINGTIPKIDSTIKNARVTLKNDYRESEYKLKLSRIFKS